MITWAIAWSDVRMMQMGKKGFDGSCYAVAMIFDFFIACAALG